MPTRSDPGRNVLASILLVAVVGCGGPSPRELKNRQEFEALLTAISLRDAQELEADSRRIDARHAANELDDANAAGLRAIIARARAGDWAGAERAAYEFRERRPYFR